MRFTVPTRSKNPLFLAVASGIFAGLISIVHHWYGALAYNTPWRTEVSYWIAGIVLIVYSLLYVYRVNIGNIVGKIAVWLFFFCAAIFQAGFVMFECVYSHVLKNFLFFAGMSQSVLDKLYPSPAYHLPDNLFFELTGLLQLVGFVAAWYAYQVFRDRPWV